MQSFDVSGLGVGAVHAGVGQPVGVHVVGHVDLHSSIDFQVASREVFGQQPERDHVMIRVFIHP